MRKIIIRAVWLCIALPTATLAIYFTYGAVGSEFSQIFTVAFVIIVAISGIAFAEYILRSFYDKPKSCNSDAYESEETTNEHNRSSRSTRSPE